MIPATSGETVHSHEVQERRPSRASEAYSPFSAIAAGGVTHSRKRTHSVTSSEPFMGQSTNPAQQDAATGLWPNRDARSQNLSRATPTLPTPSTLIAASTTGEPSSQTQLHRSRFSPIGVTSHSGWIHAPAHLPRAESSYGPFEGDDRDSDVEQHVIIPEWQDQMIDMCVVSRLRDFLGPISYHGAAGITPTFIQHFRSYHKRSHGLGYISAVVQ